MNTKERIAAAAYRVALAYGLMKLTRARIAEEAGVNEALVNYHWGNALEQLTKEVVAKAEEDKNEKIMTEAVALGYLAGYGLALVPEA